MDKKVMDSAANNIRVLEASMVETAKSGHPGGAMGGADFINTLYSRFLVYDPENPLWIARDRFFLDPGHMSTMLYSVLALAGKYTMDELKQFRQWGSVTPGHPELDPERGIENASGPLGQGHVLAVGCAIAERFLVAHFGKVCEHKTYAFISDGGIEEEISQGAGRIAGKLGLHNLIMFYDSNKVQLSTMVDVVSDEDTAAKYRAWNWNVIEIDGNDCEAIAGALETAQREEHRPTLIIGHTLMAKGAIDANGKSVAGTIATHGQPLSAAGADFPATVRNLGGDPDNLFTIRPEVKKLYADRAEELRAIVAERKAEEKAWAEANPELAKTLRDYIDEKLPDINWDGIEFKPNMASRNSSATVLGVLAEHVGNMIVGSADLANSDKTDGYLKKTRIITPQDFGGKFLQPGVAELTMAALMNGIVLHGAMRAACGTFFVFSDYIKPVLRMSALMEQPVVYVFTHDAFRVGEDGPTHQPVEHLASYRAMPNVLMFRPCDVVETAEAWQLALTTETMPSLLALSRQNLPLLRVSSRQNLTAKGGYVISDVAKGSRRQATIIATGSEVSIAVEAQKKLREEGIEVAVVSMPCTELFDRQDEKYRNRVLGRAPRIVVEAAAKFGWEKYLGSKGEIIGMDGFGASGPASGLYEHFGITADAVAAAIRKYRK